MPEVLTQNLINGNDYPSKLEWFSFDNPNAFKVSLRKALGGASSSSPPPIGLATLVPKNGVLEGFALCIGHTIYVLRTKAGKLAKSRSTLDDDKLLLSICPRLVGIGMARIALHIKHRLGYHVRGYEVLVSYDSPGQAVYDLDDKSDSFCIDRVWDIIPSKANAEALENLCLRAWITMMYVVIITSAGGRQTELVSGLPTTLRLHGKVTCPPIQPKSRKL